MSERILEDFEPGELTCQELAELVSDYIEGVLAPPVQERDRGAPRRVRRLHRLRRAGAHDDRGRAARSAAARSTRPRARALLDLFRGWAASGGSLP